jgi:hypothetical protein
MQQQIKRTPMGDLVLVGHTCFSLPLMMPPYLHLLPTFCYSGHGRCRVHRVACRRASAEGRVPRARVSLVLDRD